MEMLEKIDEANIGWIRCDFNWNRIEPESGKFDYTDTDRVVNFCEAKGIQVFPTIGYTPTWASDEGLPNSMPRSMTSWFHFVINITRRYGRYIKYWGIWNEPNIKDYFNGSIDDYFTRILWFAYMAIYNISKTMEYDLKIVAPEVSTSEDAPNWPDWLDRCRKYDGIIDVISFHTYAPTGKRVADYIKYGKWPRYMGWLQPLLDKWYPHKQAVMNLLKPFIGTHEIWLGETGWSTHLVSQAEQKYNYKELYYESFPSYCIDRIFFYDLVDEPRPEYEKFRFGILKSDLSHKMTYDWLKSL
jgi:hypothetical protein